MDLDQLSQKLDAVYASVEKTRRYIQWAFIATVVALVLPLIAALFIVPAFVTQYTTIIDTVVQ